MYHDADGTRSIRFDPEGPNLTAEQKLYNVKVKVNSIKRHLDKICHNRKESAETVKLAHLMKAAIAEIEKEIDRTV